MKIGENLKHLRIQFGISQYELAKKLPSLNQSQIAKIENGHRRLLAEEARQIASVLNVDVTKILGVEQEDT